MSADIVYKKLYALDILDEDSNIGILSAGPYVRITDGERELIATKHVITSSLRSLKNKDPRFWSGDWINGEYFSDLPALWQVTPGPTYEASAKTKGGPVPIGQLRALGPKEYVAMLDSGEMAIIPTKDTAKWSLKIID